MGLKETFETQLKDAMKAKDTARLDVVRMIRSQVNKAVTTQGKELTDELYQETIASYVKQMRRALTEYEEAGEKGAEMAAKLRFEVDFLEPFLPQMMGEAKVLSLVKAAIEQAGIKDAKQAGRVVGLVMKEHKGKVEPAVVKKLAEQELSG